MPLRQRLRDLKRHLLHPAGDASMPGGLMGQSGSGGGGQTDTSARSSVSTALGHRMPASTTSMNVSPTQPPHIPVVGQDQSEPESCPQPSPAPVNLDKSASLPEHLWDRAYDDLKVHETVLIQAYEKILSSKLYDRSLEFNGDVYEKNTIAQDDPGARRAQMEQLVTSGLAKITREAKIKESTGVQIIMSAKEMISSAIQTIPQAALAWTGVCVALEVVLSITKIKKYIN